MMTAFSFWSSVSPTPIWVEPASYAYRTFANWKPASSLCSQSLNRSIVIHSVTHCTATQLSPTSKKKAGVKTEKNKNGIGKNSSSRTWRYKFRKPFEGTFIYHFLLPSLPPLILFACIEIASVVLAFVRWMDAFAYWMRNEAGGTRKKYIPAVDYFSCPISKYNILLEIYFRNQVSWNRLVAIGSIHKARSRDTVLQMQIFIKENWTICLT